jgi:hypothetical protein
VSAVDLVGGSVPSVERHSAIDVVHTIVANGARTSELPPLVVSVRTHFAFQWSPRFPTP